MESIPRLQLADKHIISNSSFALKYYVFDDTRSCYVSEQFVVGGMVACQFMADLLRESGLPKITVRVKFEMINKNMNFHPKVRTKSSLCRSNVPLYYNALYSIPFAPHRPYPPYSKVVDTTITSNDWIYIDKYYPVIGYSGSFICLSVQVVGLDLATTPFHGLYDDTLTDFELCGDDGSISAHKAVLAASSPVLSTMLSGQWKETSEGKVELTGITVETLADLKAYIYQHKVPNEDCQPLSDEEMYSTLENLMKLACYLMMPDLTKVCTAQFLLGLTNENAYTIMGMAIKYKQKSLMNGILLSIKHWSKLSIELPEDWE